MNKNKLYTDVAKLHSKALGNSFLPTLGIKFLSLMYKCIDESSSYFLITKHDNNDLVGFVSGTLGVSNLYLLMLKHPFKLFLILLPSLVNPFKIKKIFNIFFHTIGKNRNMFPNAELLSIAVSNMHHRKGHAKNLYNSLIVEFKRNNISEFTIIVGKELDANSFYNSVGAIKSGVIEVHVGSKSNVYIHQI